MGAPQDLIRLAGRWAGTSRLWLDPAETAAKAGRACASTATIATAAQGKFVTLAYTWSVDGDPQEGLLLLGSGPAPEGVRAVWIDSWHMHDQLMLCEGSAGAPGVISVRGSYAAPTGPDWGWRIEIQPAGSESFTLRMYNLPPKSPGGLAVEAVYTRQPATG